MKLESDKYYETKLFFKIDKYYETNGVLRYLLIGIEYSLHFFSFDVLGDCTSIKESLN